MTTYTRFPLSKARFMTWLLTLPDNEPVHLKAAHPCCDCPLEVALSVLVEKAEWTVSNIGFKRFNRGDNWGKLPQWADSFIQRIDDGCPNLWKWTTITAAQCISVLKKSR